MRPLRVLRCCAALALCGWPGLVAFPAQASTVFAEPSASSEWRSASKAAWIREQGARIRIDDMVFDRDTLLRKGGFTSTRWTGGRLYYEFHDSIAEPDRQRIRAWIEAWRELAHVEFIESSSATNRVRVSSEDSGCWASVGMIGGVQPLNLGATCLQERIVRHEFGHALGLAHEQSRSDRDAHVTVIESRVNPMYLHNFAVENTVNHGPYDYLSIMHYGSCTFGNGTCPNLLPIPSDRQCTRPRRDPVAPGQAAPCIDLFARFSFATTDDLTGLAHHYGTTASFAFSPLAQQAGATVGFDGELCSASCSASVPMQQALTITLVAGMGKLRVGPCLLSVGQSCSVDMTRKHEFAVRTQRETITALLASGVFGPGDQAVFRDGFETR